MTKRLRRLGLALLLGVFVAGSFQAPTDAALRLIAGVCTFDLKVVRSTTEIEVTTPSEGLCVTSDGTADAGFTAPDLRPIVGSTCGVGAVDGGGAFDLAFNPIENMGWTGLDVMVVYADSAVQMEFRRHDGDGSIVATGTFAQLPSGEADCDTSPTTYTWSGVIVFEDPVFE